jgi:hypothetical protein
VFNPARLTRITSPAGPVLNIGSICLQMPMHVNAFQAHPQMVAGLHDAQKANEHNSASLLWSIRQNY